MLPNGEMTWLGSTGVLVRVEKLRYGRDGW
jgi:hypothetical protein